MPIAVMRSMICFLRAGADAPASQITAPTPMMIPSIARNERSLLASRLLQADLDDRSRSSMASTPTACAGSPAGVDDPAVADVDLPRWQCAAMSGSCVTMMMVRPCVVERA